jgi:hypothetical protein
MYCQYCHVTDGPQHNGYCETCRHRLLEFSPADLDGWKSDIERGIAAILRRLDDLESQRRPPDLRGL